MTVKEKLTEILQAIQAESVSYSEILYLTEHKKEIKRFFPDCVPLFIWAGIDESEYLNN